MTSPTMSPWPELTRELRALEDEVGTLESRWLELSEMVE